MTQSNPHELSQGRATIAELHEEEKERKGEEVSLSLFVPPCPRRLEWRCAFLPVRMAVKRDLLVAHHRSKRSG